MAGRPVACHTCRSWDREVRRCRIGKANPARKHEAQTVAELLGLQALCLFNPHREPLILRMRFPHRPFVWSTDAAPVPRPAIEVEVLPDDCDAA